MNKRHLHHVWRKLQIVSQWYFLAAAVALAVVFIFSYRQNNLTAIKLRDKALLVDKNNGNVEAALRELRSFTYAHMNANLSGGGGSIYPPIQLKDRYDRLVGAEKGRVEQANLAEAQNAVTACASNPSRLLCEQRYVTDHTHVASAIPDGLYKFDFVAPSWSPDVAGWSLIGSFVLLALFAVRFIAERWLRYSLKNHQ